MTDLNKTSCFQIEKLTNRLKTLERYKYDTMNVCNTLCEEYRKLIKLELLEALKHTDILVFKNDFLKRSFFIDLFVYDDAFLEEVDGVSFSNNTIKIFAKKVVEDND